MQSEIAKLSRRGFQGCQIAEMVDLSPAEVSRHLAHIRELYKNATVLDRASHVGECVLALQEVRREAWAEWERSKQNLTQKMNEVGENDKGGYTKEKIVEEGRLAYAEYMRIVMETWDKEMELTGHKPDPKTAGDVNVNVMNVDWSSLSKRPADVRDPLAERINMLPPAPPGSDGDGK